MAAAITPSLQPMPATAKLAEKIWHNEFIDIGALLPSRLGLPEPTEMDKRRKAQGRKRGLHHPKLGNMFQHLHHNSNQAKNMKGMNGCGTTSILGGKWRQSQAGILSREMWSQVFGLCILAKPRLRQSAQTVEALVTGLTQWREIQRSRAGQRNGK